MAEVFGLNHLQLTAVASKYIGAVKCCLLTPSFDSVIQFSLPGELLQNLGLRIARIHPPGRWYGYRVQGDILKLTY
jgi:hypothetical protein